MECRARGERRRGMGERKGKAEEMKKTILHYFVCGYLGFQRFAWDNLPKAEGSGSFYQRSGFPCFALFAGAASSCALSLASGVHGTKGLHTPVSTVAAVKFTVSQKQGNSSLQCDVCCVFC